MGAEEHEKIAANTNGGEKIAFDIGCIAIAVYCVFECMQNHAACAMWKLFTCSICGKRLLHKMNPFVVNRKPNEMQKKEPNENGKCLTIVRRQATMLTQLGPRSIASCETQLLHEMKIVQTGRNIDPCFPNSF